jgi:hypothetical protein
MMTASLQLTGQKDLEEQEVGAYAKLMEDREPLVAQLSSLRESLGPDLRTTPQFADIKRLLTDIADMDKEHLIFMGHLRDDMQKAIKDIKSGRKVSAAYGMDSADVGASYFDTKQ